MGSINIPAVPGRLPTASLAPAPDDSGGGCGGGCGCGCGCGCGGCGGDVALEVSPEPALLELP
jgi:hypothetical protein